MPRKPNYQFEKRQKELDRKSRKEEKLRRRQERTAEEVAADDAADIEALRPSQPTESEQPQTPA